MRRSFLLSVLIAIFTIFILIPNLCLAEIMINEIRIDQTSTDYDEYFELIGQPGASLDGLTYLVIGDGTGGSGVIEAVVDLAGQAIPSSGFFVAAESTFTLSTKDLTTDLNFENSDNVTHLLVRNFTGANGDDLDTDDDGVLDVTPWDEIVDLIALIEEENPPSGTEYHYGPPTVGPDGSFVPGHALRCPEGWQIGQFNPVGGFDTPGAENLCGARIVALDIKPGSCPNPLNVKSMGVLSVAILGTSSFDVSQIDTSTLTLNGVPPISVNGTYDVSQPYVGELVDCDSCVCGCDIADGYDDLLLKFDRQEIIATLEEVSDGDCVILDLEGNLLDGTIINGHDIIKILKKDK